MRSCKPIDFALLMNDDCLELRRQRKKNNDVGGQIESEGLKDKLIDIVVIVVNHAAKEEVISNEQLGDEKLS